MSSTTPPADRRPNRLSEQTSPYLLQHAYNPVDWHPWGKEALERAQEEDKPIFLSIGYAACHWCHVMERESFENDAVAELLNRHFIPIKVDREERPDVDEIYMIAVQLLTGQGGWPLSVFLAPDLRPFLGGTYFPPESRQGRLGFAELLERVRQAWSDRREEVDSSAEQLTGELQRLALGPAADPTADAASPAELAGAVSELAARFDSRHGGFSHAPKFPPDSSLALLLHEHAASSAPAALAMVETTLERMARGGIYDHIGGGFARYSVDGEWLVPHFEKMLYNQALLVPTYSEAWLRTAKPLYRRVVEQTLDFVRRELTDDSGGFHSSLDADSEGEEGRFYVWTPQQITDVLGEQRGRWFCEAYDVTDAGNFEGRGIPNLLRRSLGELAPETNETEEQLAVRVDKLREELLTARARRVRPATDDKVLTAWNGLMIGALARAYQVFGREVDLDAARRAADFALETMMADGRLKVTYRKGVASLNGYLDDYAFLGSGLVDLYESGFDERYMSAALTLGRALVEQFQDPEGGGFFFVSHDHEQLLTRPRSLHDGALPAGAGYTADLLLRLGVHYDAPELRLAAERALLAAVPAVRRAPSVHSALVLAAERARRPPAEVAIVGPLEDPRTTALLAVAWRTPGVRPLIQAGATGSGLAILADRPPVDNQPTAYVCRDYSCKQPTNDPEEFRRLLIA